LEGGVKPFLDRQNKDKDTSKPTPKQPTSFDMEYKYKEERERMTHLLPKTAAACRSSLPLSHQNLNQTSRECFVNV
jgi:hypothetical protein